MSGKLIDGIAIGKEIREEIKERVTTLKEQGATRLAVILVGENQASHTYVETNKNQVLKWV